MELYRAALFVSYLCLLQCDLYQGRAFEKEKTVIRLQIPLSSLTLYNSPNDSEVTKPTICKNCQNGQQKPSAVVLSMPASGSKNRKTNIVIDMSGKNKCQYMTGGVEKNETLNVDVYVNDKQNESGITTGDTIATSSNSTIIDGKDGIKVIGSSKSTTPDSNLTVIVNVYLKDEKSEINKPIVTTNSTIIEGKGDKATTDTGASESGGSAVDKGKEAVIAGGVTVTKDIVVGSIVSGISHGNGSSGGSSSDGSSSDGSSSDGSSSDGSSSDGSSSDGSSSDVSSSDESSSDGSSSDGSLSDGSSSDGSSSDGASSGGTTSDGGSTNTTSSDGSSSDTSGGESDPGSSGAADDGSSGGGSSDGTSAAAVAGATSSGGDSEESATAAAAAVTTESKGKDADGGD